MPDCDNIAMSSTTVPTVGAIQQENVKPIDLDSNVLVYTECEFCDGLFPQQSIDSHVRVGHDDETSSEPKRRRPSRRIFAVTELNSQKVKVSKDGMVAMDNGVVGVEANKTVVTKSEIVEGGDTDLADFLLPTFLTPAGRAVLDGNNWTPNYAEGSDDEENTNKRAKAVRRTNRTKNKVKKKYKYDYKTAGPRRKYHRKWDPTEHVVACSLTLDSFPDIPLSFGTSLLATKPTDALTTDQVDMLVLRSDVRDKDQIRDWVEEMANKSGTVWNLVTSKPNKYHNSSHYSQYKCKYSRKVASLRKVPDEKQNLECQAQIVFNVRTDKNYCVVKFERKHTHPLGEHRKMYSKAVPKETVLQFESYFGAGMYPTAALQHHEKLLRSRPGFSEEILQDRAIMPSLGQLGTLYKRFVAKTGGVQQGDGAPLPDWGSYDPRYEDEEIMMHD